MVNGEKKTVKNNTSRRLGNQGIPASHIRGWLPAMLIAGMIIGLSSIPDLRFFDERSLPPLWQRLIHDYWIRIGQSGFFSYAFSLHPDYLLHKMGHITLFGLLGAALYYSTRGRALLSVFLVGCFAISDEIHQAFVPGRSSRLGDVILDIAAAAIAILLVKRIFRHFCHADSDTKKDNKR